MKIFCLEIKLFNFINLNSIFIITGLNGGDSHP